MGRDALGDRARARRSRADRGGRVGALPRRDRRRANRRSRASTARRRGPRSTGSRTTELAPRLEALYYLGWAETYLERYDDGDRSLRARASRSRARPATGGCSIPMMLGKNFPFEMTGPPGRGGSSAARRRSRPRGCRPARTSCTGRCSSSAGRSTTPAISTARSRPSRRACASIAAWPAARSRTAAAGRAGRSASRWFDAGEVERGRKILLELGGEDVARTMPVERCFDWESLTLVELAVGNAEAADAYARRAEEDAAQLGLQLPAALAGRARAAVLLAGGEPAEAARSRRLDPPRPPTRSARSCTRRSRAASRGARSRPPASAARRSRCCARPSASSTRAARCACATRRAASCASSAPEPRRAGRPATGESGRRVADQARARDRRRWRPTARRTARSPPSSS